MRKPVDPDLPNEAQRVEWTLDFVKAVEAASNLGDRKFLLAVAALQFDSPDRPQGATEAAVAWVKRRGPDGPGAPVEPPVRKNRPMKTVAFYKWIVWNLQGTKKVKTQHLMTEEVALARHPEAVKVEGTCEMRVIPDDEDSALYTLAPGSRR